MPAAEGRTAGAGGAGRCPGPGAVQRRSVPLRAGRRSQRRVAAAVVGSSEALGAGIGSLRMEINLFRVKVEASRADTEFSTVATLRAAAVLSFTNACEWPAEIEMMMKVNNRF